MIALAFAVFGARLLVMEAFLMPVGTGVDVCWSSRVDCRRTVSAIALIGRISRMTQKALDTMSDPADGTAELKQS